MSATQIGLILWRTPRHARRYGQHGQIPHTQWYDRVVRWLPVPRWAKQHALLTTIMRLPVQQRLALLQITYPHILGVPRNPRMLFLALKACAPSDSGGRWRSSPRACAQYEPFLALGQTRATQRHVRHCTYCQQMARRLTRTRHAVVATIAGMHVPAQTRIPAQSWLIGILAVIGLLMVGFVVPLYAQPHDAVAVSWHDPRDLLQRATKTLYQPPALADGMASFQQYDIFWQFADGAVAQLNGELWYSRAPAQYRAQLTHHAGGAPYERDIATQAFRLYAASPAYVANIWLAFVPTSAVMFPMVTQQPDEALVWRMHQGAWGVARRVLDEMQRAPTITIMGSAIGDDGTALMRMQSGAWIADIDPVNARLHSIWRSGAGEMQMRWHLRWQKMIPVQETQAFMITATDRVHVVTRTEPAIHPALPLLAAGENTQLRDNRVMVQTSLNHCVVTLSDDVVVRCNDAHTGTETVYTDGRIP